MIRNITKNKIIVSEIEKADSFWKKAKGLMFRKELDNKKGMLFTFENEDLVGIWMLFMRFPIDLIFLDFDKQIVEIRKNIKPVSLNPRTWKVYYPDVPAKYILEINSGVARKTGTEIGDILDFK